MRTYLVTIITTMKYDFYVKEENDVAAEEKAHKIIKERSYTPQCIDSQTESKRCVSMEDNK